MRILIAAGIAALALVSCTTTGGATPGAKNVSDGNDCAVMTAILKQHYKIDANTRLHILRGDPSQPDDYRITCDFKAAGVPIEDYDYAFKSTSRENFQGWVSFSKPSYSGTTATVETGYLMGPLAGAGQKCTVQSGVAGSTVTECKMSWIS